MFSDIDVYTSFGLYTSYGPIVNAIKSLAIDALEADEYLLTLYYFSFAWFDQLWVLQNIL